jgi:hypothetical protein
MAASRRFNSGPSAGHRWQRFAILRDPHFRTVASDGRKLLGGKSIDIVERTAADQRHAPEVRASRR